MSEIEKRLICESLALLEQQAELVPLLFFQRLFTTAPALQPLFRSDARMSVPCFFSILYRITRALDTPQRMLSAPGPLAGCHRRYRMKAWHYENLGEALLWTFNEALGPRFTPEMREAWRAAFRVISFA